MKKGDRAMDRSTNGKRTRQCEVEVTQRRETSRVHATQPPASSPLLSPMQLAHALKRGPWSIDFVVIPSEFTCGATVFLCRKCLDIGSISKQQIWSSFLDRCSVCLAISFQNKPRARLQKGWQQETQAEFTLAIFSLPNSRFPAVSIGHTN